MKSNQEIRRHLHRLTEAEMFILHAAKSCDVKDPAQGRAWVGLVEGQKHISAAMADLSTTLGKMEGADLRGSMPVLEFERRISELERRKPGYVDD